MPKHVACLAAIAVATILGGCDAAKPAEPVVVAEPAAPAAPPPPPPLAANTALAQVDQKLLCSFFVRAMSDTKTKLTKGDCTPQVVDTALKVSAADGSGLVVPLVEAGAVVQLSAENASARAVADTKNGTFSNIGVLFIGRATASGLCLTVDYYAPSGEANSLFVLTKAGVDPDIFNMRVSKEGSGTASFETPVVQPGQTGVFALMRREAELGVKSVTFRNCGS